jgi:hypothetical protein
VNQFEVVVTNQDRVAMHTLAEVVVNTIGGVVKHTLEVVVTNLVRAFRQQEDTLIVERQMLVMKMAPCKGKWKKINMVIVVIRMKKITKRMHRFLIHGIRTSHPE